MNELSGERKDKRNEDMNTENNNDVNQEDASADEDIRFVVSTVLIS